MINPAIVSRVSFLAPVHRHWYDCAKLGKVLLGGMVKTCLHLTTTNTTRTTHHGQNLWYILRISFSVLCRHNIVFTGHFAVPNFVSYIASKENDTMPNAMYFLLLIRHPFYLCTPRQAAVHDAIARYCWLHVYGIYIPEFYCRILHQLYIRSTGM